MMAKKKKLKPFRAVTAVKSQARQVIGTPPASRIEENPRKNLKEKYKKRLADLLESEER
jgi:hypothetical protein